MFQRGHSHTFEHYVAARKHIEAARHHLDRFFDGFDCLVTPSAPGEAPIGLSDTGPSTFNKIWTVLHVPCVNVPAGRGSNGLPFGLQVISARYRDEVALAGATQLRAVLGELSGN